MTKRRRSTIVPNRMYTAREAASFLGLTTPESVKDWIRRGRLNAIQVGARRVWMIRGHTLVAKRKELNLHVADGRTNV